MQRILVRRAALILACVCGAVLSNGAASAGDPGVTPYRAMRYARVVGQTSWVTCGPAAVATLLKHYLAIPASERDVLFAIAASEARAAAPAGTAVRPEADSGAPVNPEGYSMLELKRALLHFGVESTGYQVDVNALREYFGAGGYPVLIHLARPQLHFAVLVGGAGEWALLGDPAFGERSVPWDELGATYGFTGNVLVPLPASGQIEIMLAAQAAAMRAYTDKFARLRRLGEAI